ncbi:MAG: ABC transporter ATP-binding protein [Alphaproteobacteria bacterium]|nr:ABC transporter ATP-binding protein [Alphaproteobacteria bacterium]
MSVERSAAVKPDAAGVALSLRGIKRRFHQGGAALDVLRGVDLDLPAGEVRALVGPSGAGKSTLLQIAGLLERPDGGEVVLAGESSAGLSDGARTRIRREKIGFVYQFHHLLPEFNALENVVLPQMLAGKSRRDASDRAMMLLTALGVGERASHRPARLSGGEQQRVAIARALANRPAVLLADEPTGNLDEETAGGVFDMLMATIREEGSALMVATHNPELARRTDGIARLHNGLIEWG